MTSTYLGPARHYLDYNNASDKTVPTINIRQQWGTGERIVFPSNGHLNCLIMWRALWKVIYVFFFSSCFSRFSASFWKSNASVVHFSGYKTNFAKYWQLFQLKVEKKDLHLDSGYERRPVQNIVILINSGQVRLIYSSK